MTRRARPPAHPPAPQAISRTAKHRLERGIWTSPGAGDIRCSASSFVPSFTPAWCPPLIFMPLLAPCLPAQLAPRSRGLASSMLHLQLHARMALHLPYWEQRS